MTIICTCTFYASMNGNMHAASRKRSILLFFRSAREIVACSQLEPSTVCSPYIAHRSCCMSAMFVLTCSVQSSLALKLKSCTLRRRNLYTGKLSGTQFPLRNRENENPHAFLTICLGSPNVFRSSVSTRSSD